MLASKRLLAMSVLLAAAAFFPLTVPVHASESPAPEPSAVNGVPIKRVVLFTSGVGYFERLGTVEGNTTVQLRFRVDDVNDLLKSMVVRDLDGGQVASVRYASKDPISKTLKSFAIDLTEEKPLAQLLSQLRGQQVIVYAPEEYRGAILGTEEYIEKTNDTVIKKYKLNIATAEGITSLPLEMVGRIKLADPRLDKELQRALETLASALDNTKRTVEISFTGQGKRRVWIGYVVEAPIWKTSYRLVLEEDKKALLQGWAIVENTTDEDWDNVELRLVSGRPISFVMNLYEPIYVPRPEEQLELYTSIRPPVYEKALAAKKQAAEDKAAAEFRARRALAFGGAAAGRPQATAPLAEMEALSANSLARSIAPATAAGEVGALFEYRITAPVSINRQQSAMLPIINSEIPYERVAIYNEQVNAKHPLAGVRLVNETDLYIMQGPITVFEKGTYAGDAKILDIPPGEKQLISYALDLKTEVDWKAKSAPQQLISVRLQKGTMITTHKLFRSREYTLKNSDEEAKHVLIEYPIDPNWRLVEPSEPEEKTRSYYRFGVDVPGGKSVAFTVREERTMSQSIAITNLDDRTIAMYISSPVVSDKIKAALQEVVRRKHEIQTLTRQIQQLEQEVNAIAQDQARIRENMARLDRTSELYRRYVKKFSDQEDQIETLREKIKELRDRVTQLQKELDEYIMSLNL